MPVFVEVLETFRSVVRKQEQLKSNAFSLCVQTTAGGRPDLWSTWTNLLVGEAAVY